MLRARMVCLCQCLQRVWYYGTSPLVLSPATASLYACNIFWRCLTKSSWHHWHEYTIVVLMFRTPVGEFMDILPIIHWKFSRNQTRRRLQFLQNEALSHTAGQSFTFYSILYDSDNLYVVQFVGRKSCHMHQHCPPKNNTQLGSRPEGIVPRCGK